MMKRLTGFGLALLVGGVTAVLFFGFYDYVRGEVNGEFGTIQKIGVFVGIGLLLLGGSYLFSSFWRYLFRFLFIFGVFLLTLNIYGEFVSLRNPKVDEGAYYANKFRKPQETPEQVYKQIDKGQNESDEDYAYRLNDLVYSATIHKWWEDVVDYTEYNHQVPPHENYFMWALSYFNPDTYLFYHFCDPYKAIERGVMICSQSTEVMVTLWRKTKLRARSMALDGHVVAEVQVNREKDIWWVLDADFGVVLEYDISTLEQNPDIVIESYVNAGYDLALAEKIAKIYGKDGNYVQTNVKVCRVEESLYKWKWYFPILLLMISSLYFGGVWLIRRRSSVSV